MAAKSRVYHDPIHGAIELKGQDPIERMVIQLIDTPEFQRLRRVRQLDIAHLTFHGAEGSRFTHSLGVFAVARRIFDRLSKSYPDLESYRVPALAGALLHDIGHGPFSHASEEIFHYDHETWTQHIVLGETRVNQILRDFAPNLPGEVQQVMAGTFPVPLVSQLVSGQLDADRLDYLLRDSYFTGAKYGQLDLDRLVGALDYDRATRSLVVKGNKGLVAVEHYLVVRYFMYTQVYNHPKNLAARFVLKSILRRAREQLLLGELTVDELFTPWFTLPPDQWSLPMYLACDDVVLSYHIQRWQYDQDPLLAQLCHQLVDRDLPKTWDVTSLTVPQQEHLLERLAGELDVPAGYGVGLKAAKVKGYSVYDRGIYLKAEDRPLQEIADCSPLVRSLLLSAPKVWLIYPRHLQEQVARLVQIEQAMAGLD
ncbi:HD domain-containing protein [Candidatus Cyanaurora vandensis]|uniref:HD domain-containing protein n=1 Tax=Candidatus Cyanaurora vandensis TaxID=2714958 RepID=UPI0025805321|nr:HD domain-containing protein [Candidatus Cyanaurora vandensis]